MVNDENGLDTEEQDDDEHNGASEEVEAKEANNKEDEEHEGDEDLAEDLGEKDKHEAQGQQEAQGEGGRYGEGEGEEKTGDEVEIHGGTRGEDRAVQNREQEERGDGREAGNKQGGRGNVRRARDPMKRQMTENNRDLIVFSLIRTFACVFCLKPCISSPILPSTKYVPYHVKPPQQTLPEKSSSDPAACVQPVVRSRARHRRSRDHLGDCQFHRPLRPSSPQDLHVT